MRRSVIFISFFLILSGCGKRAEPPYKTIETLKSFENISWTVRPEGVWLRWNFPEKDNVLEFTIFRKTDDRFIKIEETDKQEFFDRFISLGRRDYKIIALLMDGRTTETVFSINIGGFPESVSDIFFEIKEDRIEIRWKGIEGARYNVYRSDEKGVYKEPINNEPLETPFYIDSITPYKTFYYTVRTFIGDKEGFPSPELTISPELFVPERPMGIRFVRMEYGLLLIWSPSKESWIRGYRIYRDDGEGYIFIAETPVPVFSDNGYNDKKTRRYMIKAIGPLKEGEGSVIEILK